MPAARFLSIVFLVTLCLALATAGPVVAGSPGARTLAGPSRLAGPAAPLPTSISYQGYLTDAGGSPLAGNHDLTFQLWDDAVGGSQLGADISVTAVPVTDGVFTTAVPVDPAHFAGQGLWLRLAVDGSWLSPRQALLPVPYAIGLMPRAVVDGDHTDPTLTVRNVSGTGLLVGSSILGIDVGGDTALRATGRGIGIEARGMTGLSAEGDVGVSASGIVGVRGTSDIGHAVEGTSGSSIGVYGESTGAYGVHGKSQRDSGVYGESSDGFSSGVEGHGASGVFGTGAVVGVSGYSEADGMTGVLGTAPGLNATGVGAIANGYGSTGVSGVAQFGTGVLGKGEIGVKGEGSVSSGVMGKGVVGVVGESSNGLGAGVSGTSTNGVGVVGESTGGVGVRANGAGVWAEHAALRADNSNPSQGMAAHFTNKSNFANTHLYNSGTGEVLVLQSNGGRFLAAMGAGWDTKFRLEYNGNAYADGSWNAGGADFAELLPAVPGLAPGDVLVIGSDGLLHRADGAFATGVAGVYSTRPGFLAGQPIDGAVEGSVPLAVMGVVPVKVSAENGAIVPGDLLVTASLAGHAMRAGQEPPQGTVIGKALGGLDCGTGVIRMLASLQ